jgi:hypothetical protein
VGGHRTFEQVAGGEALAFDLLDDVGEGRGLGVVGGEEGGEVAEFGEVGSRLFGEVDASE